MKSRKIAIIFSSNVEIPNYEKARLETGVNCDFYLYDDVNFSTKDCRVKLKNKKVKDYDVLFFRTTGLHYEEISLIISDTKPETLILDPLMKRCRLTDIRKAYQMLSFTQKGFSVPQTTYGNLKILKQIVQKENVFPRIIKGSKGDRGTTVYIIKDKTEIETTFENLKNELQNGQRFMLQEFIPNDGDYRIIVLGDKVVGCVKRQSQSKEEFRNNMSRGGLPTVVELPEAILDLAKKATQSYGLFLAGVDIVFKDNDLKKPYFWEINYAPQYKKFFEATGINVPEEVLKALDRITIEEYKTLYPDFV